MKEIMVIKDEQAIDEWNRTIAQFIDVDNKIYKAEFIKVPENWEELKELCEELESKNVFIINAGNCIEFNGLYFWKDGSITTTQNNNDIWATKTNLTPARQWNIIKSLIGEE